MLVKVKVFPNAKNQEIIKKSPSYSANKADSEGYAHSFEIKVKEKPKNNEANLAVFEVLADYFHVKHSRIRLIKGAKERNKIFEISKFGTLRNVN